MLARVNGSPEEAVPNVATRMHRKSGLTHIPTVRIWWGYLESNQGPQHYQCCALTS